MSHVPFSMGAWRARVGGLEESLRGFVTGEPPNTEAAHPLRATLFDRDDAVLTPLARYAAGGGLAARQTHEPRRRDAAPRHRIPRISTPRSPPSAPATSTAARKRRRRCRHHLADTAARWVGLKLHSHEAGFKRITAFLEAHPDWPAADWLRRRAEEALVSEHQPDKVVKGWFAQTKPQTAYGKYALAKALARDGEFESAAALTREAWREDDLAPELRNAIPSRNSASC